MSGRKKKPRKKSGTEEIIKRPHKGGATMWQRLNYFESDVASRSDRLKVLAEWLDAGDAALTAERCAAGARFLRRLLSMPGVVQAINVRATRGRLGSRKGEDVALYFHVCKLQEGDGGYRAALQRTKEAWRIAEKTIEQYGREHGELAKARYEDVRASMFPAQMKALGDRGFHDALLQDILDDHKSDPAAPWRIDFLREKDSELEAEGLTDQSQIAAMNRRAITQELERISKLAE